MRQGVFLLLDGEDAKNKFCRNALHVQILYQNALASSTLYASLCRNFMPCKSPIFMDYFLHMYHRITMTICCSLSNQGLSSAGVWPSLSLLNHSNE